MLLMFQLFI